MKKTALLFVFVAIGIAAFSQTKRIAHRSHSGSNNTFHLFATDYNFGRVHKNETHRKPVPKKDTLKVIIPGKKDTLKYAPLITKEVQVKEEVFAVLAAAKYIVAL